jgi:glycosyltransferase involved in cell wall biosynthesis
MKLLYLTAGAAGMFCGSCMLDNALARAMLQQGHEVLLAPLYTPIRTDEEDVSLHQVFFGGINVYLQQKYAWARHLPGWLESWLNQPWLIRRLTANTGKTSPQLLGGLAISMLRGTDGYQRKEVFRLCRWITDDVRPDAILLTNLLIGGCLPELRRQLRQPIEVILQGDDIFLDALLPADRQVAIAAMRRLVPYVDRFIVHSRDYGNRMAELLAIPADRWRVVPLGIDTQGFTAIGYQAHLERLAKPPEEAISLGYLARMAPEKGLHHLIDAFIELATSRDLPPLRLELAGWMGPQHRAFWEEQQRKLSEAGLDGRWSYHGSLSHQAKVDFLHHLDLLSVPTVYREPKGLFVLEAVAAGVPYVQPAHGAFPELHQRLQAGCLFPPEDPVGYVDQLARQIQAIHTQRRATAPGSTPPTPAPSLIELYQQRLQEISIGVMAQRMLQPLLAAENRGGR